MGFFTNDFGEQTVVRAPNAPILGWAGFGVASMMAMEDENRRTLQLLSTTCLVLWAALELTRGESGFRRTVGAATLGWLVKKR